MKSNSSESSNPYNSYNLQSKEADTGFFASNIKKDTTTKPNTRYGFDRNWDGYIDRSEALEFANLYGTPEAGLLVESVYLTMEKVIAVENLLYTTHDSSGRFLPSVALSNWHDAYNRLTVIKAEPQNSWLKTEKINSLEAKLTELATQIESFGFDECIKSNRVDPLSIDSLLSDYNTLTGTAHTVSEDVLKIKTSQAQNQAEKSIETIKHLVYNDYNFEDLRESYENGLSYAVYAKSSDAYNADLVSFLKNYLTNSQHAISSVSNDPHLKSKTTANIAKLMALIESK